MPAHIRVNPRFGDTVRLGQTAEMRPQILAEVGPDAVLTVEVDDEPGSAELAARFARELSGVALRFAQQCDDLMITRIEEK